MPNTCVVNQRMFCKHFVMIIGSRGQIIPLPVYNKRWCNHDNKTPLVLFGSLYSNLLKVLCDVVLVR